MQNAESLLQQRLERFDNAIDKIKRLMEKFEKRLTLSNLNLAQRFVDGEINFLIHFRRRDSGELWVLCLKPVVPIEAFTQEQTVAKYLENESMLVDIVKLVESPERIIPALVRFETVDSFYRFWPHSLYFSNLRGFVVLGVSNDWKGNPITGDLSWGTDLCELISQVVQGTPEVVNDVSSDRQQLKRCHGILPNVGERGADLKWAKTEILIGNDYLVCHPLEGFSELVELEEVLFGPFDFNQGGARDGLKWTCRPDEIVGDTK